jgi:hypothetical protein
MADKISNRELAEQYGMAWAVIQGVPEIKRLFEKAYGNGKTRWSAEKFKSQFQSSKWYRDHSEAYRKARILQLSDPKTFNAEVTRVQAQVEQMAAQRGITLGPKQSWASVAQALFMSGKTDDTSVLEYLDTTKKFGATVSSEEGMGGSVVNDLEKMAYAYGYVPQDKNFYAKAAREVTFGNATIEEYQNTILEAAASQYPVFRDQILSGAVTVRDVASPYIDSMARTLELSPEAIELQDETIQKALSASYDDKGQPVVKSVWQFTKDLKEDPRWAYTKNAKDSMEQTAVGVLRAFGFQS